MTLRDRIQATRRSGAKDRRLYERFGLLENPFPPSGQTTNNPRLAGKIDAVIEQRIEAFDRDSRTQVLVVEGTQGTGKTNVLNFYEREIMDVFGDVDGYYVVRYLADPAASFDTTLRHVIQALGTDHIERLAGALAEDESAIDAARSVEMRSALRRLANDEDGDVVGPLMDWLLGFRLLNSHRQTLGVKFRLDTVEAKTGALRDLVAVSAAAGVLKGIFLLLDELEKQEGALSATATVRYLSALRAIIDAMPRHLLMMIAVTPDALRRFSLALPALRNRLHDRIPLEPLTEKAEALALAEFYLKFAEDAAARQNSSPPKRSTRILSERQISAAFDTLLQRALAAKDNGLKQRTFLHELHLLAEERIQADDPVEPVGRARRRF